MKHFFYLQAFVFVVSAFANANGSGDVLVRTKIGNACTTDAQCGSNNHCIKEERTSSGTHFASGYCVKFECSLANPCDAGAKCVEPEGVGAAMCFAQCTTDSHCRNGYRCHESGVCISD